MIGGAQIGPAVCVSGCALLAAWLAGTLGLVYWSQKAMQILPFTK